jgi:hypothetical protein
MSGERSSWGYIGRLRVEEHHAVAIERVERG